MDSELGFKKVKIDKPQNEDLLSSLPDHLLYQILAKIEIKYAVQTCILSRRWNRVWATLPHLHFDATNSRRMDDFYKFVNKFLSKRNHRTDISTIKIVNKRRRRIREELINKIVNYAVSHNVQEFSIDSGVFGEFPNRIFFSQSLKRLRLNMGYWFCNRGQSSTWELQSLTNLYISGSDHFTILPDLPQSFPVLTTLHLAVCKLPLMSWGLPVLTSLHLDRVIFHGGKSLEFDEFVHLKNLTLKGMGMWYDVEVFTISSVSLTNLTISEDSRISMTCRFEVFAPNLSCCEYRGCSPILLRAKDGLPSLEKVDIDVDVIWCELKEELKEGKPVILQQLSSMFQVFSGAKFLTLSFKMVMVLFSAVKLLKFKPSPFGNLKCLKIKYKLGSANSTIPSQVRNYLISSFPSAQILIEDKDGVRDYKPKVNMLPSHSSCGPNASMVEPKGISLDDEDEKTVLSNKNHVSDGVDRAGEKVEDQKNAHADEEQTGVQDGQIKAGSDEETNGQDRTYKGVGESLVRGDARVQADIVQYERTKETTKRIPVQVNALSNIQVIGDAMVRVRGLEPLATVQGGINDHAGSILENNTFALWQGHQVYPEFVDLLNHISVKYPETFEHFSPQTEMIYTVGLNTLCTSISDFSEVFTTKVTASTITSYRCLFADLKKWGFNIDWLVNYIDSVYELYAIDNRLESAQMKVQERHSMAKMVEIQEAFKQLRTKLKAGGHTAILFPRQ